jgi:hypothetical protein
MEPITAPAMVPAEVPSSVDGVDVELGEDVDDEEVVRVELWLADDEREEEGAGQPGVGDAVANPSIG